MMLDALHRFFRRSSPPRLVPRGGPTFARYTSAGHRYPDGFCKACGVELTGSARLVCSSNCLHEWRIRTQPQYAARFVLQRDCGICQICGVDTIGTRSEVKALRNQAMTTRGPEDLARFLQAAMSSGLLGRADAGLPTAELFWHRAWDTRPWQVDHIRPVSEGGGGCGLENLRTVCIPCHKDETARLMRRRTARKRIKR